MPRALWQDPYAAQTIDLLQEPARARAAAVQKIAEAQARAAEIAGNANANAQLVGGNAAAGAQIAGGNAWAGAIDNTARAIASIPGQIQQARAQSQADQLAKLQIAQRQQQMDASQRLASGQSTLAGAMMTSADPSMQPQGPDLSTPNGVVPQTPNFLKPDENGVHTWDIEGISKYMAVKGFGDLNPTFIKDVDGLNQAMRQESAARTATLRNIADMSYRSGNNPDIANKLVDTLKANNFYPPDALEHIRGTIGTPQFDQLVDGLRTPDKPITVAKDAILTTEERAAKGLPPLVTNTQPEKPTEASLALEAAGGNQTAAAAMNILKPQAPKPLQEQLLEAVTKGDKATIDRISTTLQTEARARQDPAAAAAALAMKNLSTQEAQARLDHLREQNQPLDVSADVRTTMSGAKYVDLSQYSGNERNKARQAAAAVGAVPVSKEQADALTSVDEARADQHAIMDQIQSLLPTGAAARPAAYVNTKLSKLFQTNDQIAAFGTMQSAAIKTMRALAGAKGLRMSSQLIDRSVQNDIPQLTDTLGVAQQKLKNIEMLLSNVEKPIVVMDRSVMQPPTPPAAPALTPGLQGLLDR